MYNKNINHIEQAKGRTYRLESLVIQNPNTSYFREKSFVRNVEIYHLGKNENQHYYQIITTNFSFSNEDNSSGKLIKKISYLFDEIEILTDDENNITKIINIIEIKKKWLAASEILSEDNGGYAIENYFGKISEMINNEKSFISFLNDYKIFGLFFNGQYGAYEQGIKKQRIISTNDREIIEHMAVKISEDELIISLEAKEAMASLYLGTFVYRKDNLVEAYLRSEKEKTHIKYSLLWIG